MAMSVWQGTAGGIGLPAASGDVDADVAVVGGGITGVTTALLLARAGRRVALLEAQEIGSGDTGRSTGNLYATLSGGGLAAVRAKWGIEVARSVAASRAGAIDFIEQEAGASGAECGFRRCSLHLYAGAAEAQAQVDVELHAARDIGLAVHAEEALPHGPPPAAGRVAVLERQAQIHPLAYVRTLAGRAIAAGAALFERSAVTDVDIGKGVLRTDAATIHAPDIVLATHSPSGFHVMQAGMLPNIEYGVATTIAAGSFPPGIFWARGEKPLSVRGVDSDEGSFLVCVGEEHPTGKHDALAATLTLEAATRRTAFAGPIAYRWSAQNFRSADGLPYIGKDLSGAWVATGFAADGLTYGTLAATVIADQILGRDNRWGELYKATRFAPAKAAKATAEETVHVVKALVEDYLTHRQHEALDALALGEGRIVELDGERIAAYRDGDGKVFAVSPVCTHLKCIVHWNAADTCWDCPCHGSRFAPDGRVISGPAYRPLSPKRPTG